METLKELNDEVDRTAQSHALWTRRKVEAKAAAEAAEKKYAEAVKERDQCQMVRDETRDNFEQVMATERLARDLAGNAEIRLKKFKKVNQLDADYVIG